MQKNYLHNLTYINENLRRGCCQHCGNVKIHSRGNGRWRCAKSYTPKKNASRADYVKLWREENPNYNREYKKENRIKQSQNLAIGRARKAGCTEIVAVSYEFVFKRDHGNCYMCMGKADTIDHIIPLSRGGLHRSDNLAPSCRSCNCKKNAKYPSELADSEIRKRAIAKMASQAYP